MWIKKMHIYGFGHFQDQVFDCHKNMQVFIGLNQAGKSTLYQFIQQMLFGFASRSQKNTYYRPLHSSTYGGKIWMGQASKDMEDFTIERLEKQGQMTCLVQLASGQEGGEDLLAQCLGGIQANWYDHFYAIHLDSLQAHQQVAMADMNQFYLNEGVLGSNRFLDLQQEKRSQADHLYRKQARIRPINVQLKQMAQVEKDLEQARANNKSYGQLGQTSNRLKEALDQDELSLKIKNKEKNKLKQLQQEWPTYQEIQALQKQLENIPDRPLPSHALHAFEENDRQMDRLKKQLNSYRQEFQSTGQADTPDSADQVKEMEDHVQTLQLTRDKMQWLEDRLVEDRQELDQLCQTLDMDPAHLKKFFLDFQKHKDQGLALLMFMHVHWQDRQTLAARLEDPSRALAPSLSQMLGQPQTLIQLGAIMVSLLLTFLAFNRSVLLLSFLGVVLTLIQVIYFMLVSPAPIQAKWQTRQAKQEEQAVKRKWQEHNHAIQQLESQWRALFTASSPCMSDLCQLGVDMKTYMTIFSRFQSTHNQLKLLQADLQASRKHLVEALGLEETVEDQQIIQAAMEKIRIKKQATKQGQESPSIYLVENQLQALEEKQQDWLDVCQAKNETELRYFAHQAAQRQDLIKEIANLKAKMVMEVEDFQDFLTAQSLHERYQQVKQDCLHLQEAHQHRKNKYLETQVLVHDLESQGRYDKLRQQFELEKSKLKQMVSQWLSYSFEAELISETIALAQEGYLPDLLDQAGQVYQSLTLGHYHRIIYQDEHLQVIDQDGHSFQVHQLSQASRDQLYLALRLSFIQSLAEFQSLPLLIDDGWVNFDDQRKASAIRVLRSMSDHNQVIIMTKDQGLADFFADEQIHYL